MAGLVFTCFDADPRSFLLAPALLFLQTVWVAETSRQSLVRMPAEIFALGRWGNRGRVFERFGVRQYRLLLVATPLKWLQREGDGERRLPCP